VATELVAVGGLFHFAAAAAADSMAC
jgi:hypothetical protein